jgi:hypothetical protein
VNRVFVEAPPVGYLDNAAEVHYCHTITYVAHYGKVMSYEKVGQSEPFLEFLQQIDNLRLYGYVESRYRFVADDQRRIAREGSGDVDPLSLSPGEFVGDTVLHLRVETDHLKKLRDSPPVLGLRVDRVVDLEWFTHHIARRLAGIKRTIRVLKHKLQIAAKRTYPSFRPSCDIVPLKEDLPSGGAIETEDATGHGRLATAAFADQTQGLAFLYFETDVVHRLDMSDRLAQDAPHYRKMHLEVFDVQDRFIRQWHTSYSVDAP